MKKTHRPVYGVIAASAADIEQKEILTGIIENAQTLDIDIAVISNIYNPNEPSDILNTENNIYDLMLSDEYDGFILISESFINTQLQQKISENFRKRDPVPIIAIGTPLPGFVLPDFKFINNSDEADMEDITNHLIEVHGMTDIDMLTGFENIEASHKRVAGYRRALEKHGIEYDEKKVYFGNFWLNSGKETAQKYISGELPCPQALICANDYMAYGLLDEFMEQSVPVREKMAVIGYEYIRERNCHTPLLSTYRRNRKSLGTEAVRLLNEKITTGEYGDFVPQKGSLIPGNTCSCGENPEDIKRELNDVHIKQTYDFLNLICQFEHSLTECQNINEFVQVCHEFKFMVRDAEQIYLCLYENWYENDIVSENITCYNLIRKEKPFTYNKNNLSAMFSGSAAPYYFTPLFFSDRELGYVVLKFDHPDTFDHIYRNWLKSISNGLEFLQMKNDIRYLTKCQNLSEQRDVLTGMYNETGIKQMLLSTEKENLYFAAIRVCLFNNDFVNENKKINALLDISEAVRQFSGSHDICARINGDTFLCLVRNEISAEFLTEKFSAILYQHTDYMNIYGTDSFVCCAGECGDITYARLSEICNNEFDSQIKVISERRREKHYKELLKIRNHIYMNPADTFETEEIRSYYSGSPGHFRTIYKKCFGISFHQDCILSRIARAEYCLSVTSMNITDIAENCGYTDNKYFMRQFLSETGFTANQYRNISK